MANVEQELVDAKRYLAEVAEKLQRLESLRKGAEEEYVGEKAILERQETKLEERRDSWEATIQELQRKLPAVQPGSKRKSSLSSSSISKRPRTFTAANGVFPDVNYFVEPKEAVELLTNFIVEGKFCLLHGHRQSGKTTVIQATERHLQKISSSINIRGFTPGLEVYIISFNAGIDVENGVSSFWESLCLKMQARYPNRFHFDQNQNQKVTAAMFETFFRRTAGSLPTVLLIDEGSFLVNRNVAIVDDFIGTLRLLRDGRNAYCLHSFILAGVETVKELLVPQRLSSSVGSISPFTREATIIPGRFIEADIRILLDEYTKEASVVLDSVAFAQDIYQRTLGHKGLVGTCCAAIEKKVALGKRSVSIDEWELYAVANLLRYIREQDTYASIVQTLRQLSEKHREIVGLTLRYGSVIVKECDELKFLLAEGIVRVQKSKEELLVSPQHTIIECAAPLLRSIMISELSGPEIEIGVAPDPHKVCPRWLIARTIENLGIQHIFAKQTLNANDQPSEYAFQVEIAAIFKQLLSKAYPTLMYHVLPEAKEYDEDGSRRKRLDILVRDSGLPAYGYELMVEANENVFNSHCERAYNYGRVHQCYMMVVHFSESGRLATYFGPGYENVTVMHVVYDVMQGSARLIYQDREELVHIKGVDWKVMFTS